MGKFEHNGHDELTLLERVLRLHGDFRRGLEPIKVTPLQAGVLLYLHRCPGTGVNTMAKDLRLQPPTLIEVVDELVRKRLIKRHTHPSDRRAKPLILTSQGMAMVPRIVDMTQNASSRNPLD